MARPRFSSIRKPQGWRGESYRHYLAAKGIKSPSPKSYFVNQAAKGNYDTGGIKAAYASGLTDEQLLQDDVREKFNDSLRAKNKSIITKEQILEKIERRKSRNYPEFLSERQEEKLGATPVSELEPSVVEQADIPLEEDIPEQEIGSESFSDEEILIDESPSSRGIQEVAEVLGPVQQPIVATDPTADIPSADNPFFKKSRWSR